MRADALSPLRGDGFDSAIDGRYKGTDAGKCKIKILNQEIFGLNFDIINLNIERYPYPLIQILGKKINGNK